MQNHIDVLDKGYVKLHTWLPYNMVELYNICEALTLAENDDEVDGFIDELKAVLNKDDLTAINAAYASFKKEAHTIEEQQKRLLAYLSKYKEASPTRHSSLTFEIKAPLIVARQWFKYRIGSTHSADDEWLLGQEQEGFADFMQGWNESSRRYIQEEPEFYIVWEDEWRSKPDKGIKQGSGDYIPTIIGTELTTDLIDLYDKCLEQYDKALLKGVAPEQARLFLPAYSLYITWRWTVSGNGIIHFLNERLAENAQLEIRQYAEAVYTLAHQVYPNILDTFVNKE